MTRSDNIFAEIQALLDRTPIAPLDDLEHTLTDGYAAALALEAERWRIERRIAEVAGEVAAASEGQEAEIAQLARRLARADDEIARLRRMLATLRERAAEARAA